MDLKAELEAEQIECRPDEWWIPINVIREKVNFRNVMATLLRSSPSIDHVSLSEYAKRIVDGDNGSIAEAEDERRQKLFALLVCQSWVKDIFAFIDDNITDADLPFTRSKGKTNMYTLCQKNHHTHCPKLRHDSCGVNALAAWELDKIRSFERFQFMVLAPVFKEDPNCKIPMLYLDRRTIMPFIEDGHLNIRRGGYSDVWPVRIHRAHQKLYLVNNTEGQEPFLAVKQLHSRDKSDFDKEYNMLSTISGHPHVIHTIAAYKMGGNYHILFAYAKLDLRSYWKSTSQDNLRPYWNRATYIWVFKQLHGLTSGLARIHGPNATLDVPNSNIVFGRHGDIKPENILYLDDLGGASREGILQIADMGLSRFHRATSRSNVDPLNVNGSPTYAAPELELQETISRAFDIWSLACVFLEFVTWLLEDSQTFHGFPKARDKTGVEDYLSDDRFYSIISLANSKRSAEVKPSVLSWMETLRNSERCSQLVEKLLRLIEDKMLRVKVEERIRIDDLETRLKGLLNEAESSNDNKLLGDDETRFDKEIGMRLPPFQWSKSYYNGEDEDIPSSEVHLNVIISDSNKDTVSPHRPEEANDHRLGLVLDQGLDVAQGYKLDDMNNLPKVVNSQGDYNEAEEILQQKLERKERVLQQEDNYYLESIQQSQDSGYASKISTDKTTGQAAENAKNDKIRTIYSDNENLKVDDIVKEKLASAISQALFNDLEFSLCQTMNNNLMIEGILAENLKSFSIRLEQTAKLGQQRDAAIFVRHYRHRIASSFKQTMQSKLESADQPDIETQDLDSNSKEPNYMDQMGMLGGGILHGVEVSYGGEDPLTFGGDEGFSNGNENNPDGSEDFLDDYEDYEIREYLETQEFLFQSNAYQWLLGRIRTQIALSPTRNVMDNISAFVLQNLSPQKASNSYSQPLYVASFKLEWSPVLFMKEQFPKNRDTTLDTVLVLTGTALNTQATTCGQYMSQTWPTSGAELLCVIQDMLTDNPKYRYILLENTQLNISIDDFTTIVNCKGSAPCLAEIGEQLAWLSAALRSSPSENMINCFTPQIKKGYPILARDPQELGLELPLSFMAELGQAPRATEFNGGVVIKGISTMFVPTKRLKNSIFWHFLFKKNGKRISYLDAKKLCPSSLTTEIVDTPCLAVTRNFLGWASSVEIHAGTSDAHYDAIKWASGLRLASAGCELAGVTVTGGKLISGGLQFRKGVKDVPLILQSTPPYEGEIRKASNMKVVLFDMRDRRGWLIDGASALLYISRSQLSPLYCRSREMATNLKNFRHADPTKGLDGSYDALTNWFNRDLLMYEDFESSAESIFVKSDKKKSIRWCFQDQVRQTYNILEQIRDHQASINKGPGTGNPISITDVVKLEGYSFMDIVDGEGVLHPMVAELEPSAREWVNFTRNIDAVTLFGDGFGDLIKPAKDCNKLCKAWTNVPTGKDFLTASISQLHKICTRYGNMEADPLELVSKKSLWHKPDKLFEDCDCEARKPVFACERIQVLLPSLSTPKKICRPFDEMKGAVIFGKSERFRRLKENPVSRIKLLFSSSPQKPPPTEASTTEASLAESSITGASTAGDSSIESHSTKNLPMKTLQPKHRPEKPPKPSRLSGKPILPSQEPKTSSKGLWARAQ